MALSDADVQKQVNNMCNIEINVITEKCFNKLNIQNVSENESSFNAKARTEVMGLLSGVM